MIQATCIKKYIENNKIIGYHLLFDNDTLQYMDSNTLKKLIKLNKFIVENLTLTTNNKLVFKEKEPKERSYTDLELKQYIGKMNLMGRCKVLSTCSDTSCYLIEKSNNNYLLYIPDNVTELNYYYNSVFTQQIRDLEGRLEVIGGKNLLHTVDMFAGCNFKYIDFTNFKTHNIVNMLQMFKNSKVQALDLSNFKVQNVNNMTSMFEGCEAEYINLTSFNTPSLVYVSGMFKNSKANILDLRQMKTNKIYKMDSMFTNCRAKKIFLNTFNTTNVNTMYEMFAECSTTELDLRNFNTRNVQVMTRMFYGCEANKINISSFDISASHESTSMFRNCQAEKYIIPKNSKIKKILLFDIQNTYNNKINIKEV